MVRSTSDVENLDSMELFLKKVIVKAGKATLKLFGKTGVKYTKSGKADVVTEADLISEKILVSEIRQNYPLHGIISEESPEFNVGSDYVWIIDPLDGTRNYSLKTPEYGVMAALCYKKRVVLSAIYLPYFKELYFARENKGAYLNGAPIHCSDTKDFHHSFGVNGSIWRENKRKLINRIIDATDNDSVWMSSFGAAAMVHCTVASGKRDWAIIQDHNIWDVAAGYLLMKEAGCAVTRLDGMPWTVNDKEFVSANPVLHKRMLEITKGL